MLYMNKQKNCNILNFASYNLELFWSGYLKIRVETV